MWKLARQTFVTIFLIGAIFWMVFVISTSFFPGSPLSDVYSAVFGLPRDFIAKAKVPPVEILTLDDWLYSDEFYNILAVGTMVVLLGLFTLVKGRNLIEKIMLLQAYALPRERDYWGKVIDKKTRAPIAFASVRLLRVQEGKNKFVAQSVADIDGRYRLYLNAREGNFVLEFVNPGYKTITQELTATMVQPNRAIRSTVFMEKENEDVKVNILEKVFSDNKEDILKLMTAIIVGLSMTTFAHAVYTLINHFNFVAVGNFIFYGFALPWNVFVIWERRKFNPGKVINSENNQPVAGVAIKVFMEGGNMVSVLSDKDGILKFDVEPGEYKMQVSKPGFSVRSNGEDILSLNVNKDGYLQTNIYLIPSSRLHVNQNALLASPFGS